MAKVSYESGQKRAKRELVAFRALHAIFKALVDGYTAQQKQDVLGFIGAGWAGATQVQKLETLRACVALAYVMIGYLVWKEFGD